MAKRLQIRRDSTANWTSNNPILAEGEIAWDTTLEKGKVGDGSTAWSSLPFSIFTQAELDAKAPLSSPALIGVPTAPTASEDTATTQIATTAFVVDQDYVKAATASSLYLTQVAASATYASVSSPTFTGTVTAPQFSASDGLIVVKRVSSVNEGGEIQLCRSSDNTTGWTIDAFGSTSTPSLRFFDSTNTVRFYIDGNGDAQMTGAPAAPTAAAGTNNTQIATTAYVRSELTYETTTDLTVSSNSTTMDIATGNVGFVASGPTANWTINFTNLPTTNGQTITATIFVTQGATGYIPATVQIGGVGQTIKWQGGSAPTPTSSSGKIDVFSFSMIRRGSAWTVLGSMLGNF